MKDKVTKEIILVVIATLILGVFAGVLYVKRSKEKPEEKKKAPTISESVKKNSKKDKKDKEESDDDKEDVKIEEDWRNEGVEVDLSGLSTEGETTSKETTSTKNEPKNTTTEEQSKGEYYNARCNLDTIPKKNQRKYANYITLSALDENGCTLEYTSYNQSFIEKMTKRAYNTALKNSKTFTYENPRKSGSIRVDQVTIRNSKGNIIGWSQILVYGDGKNSGRYAFSRNGTWEYIGV